MLGRSVLRICDVGHGGLGCEGIEDCRFQSEDLKAKELFLR
jgi:hypothetical protein